MTPERWARIEELFHRAAECDRKDRAGLLDQACANDSEMRQEIEVLLSFDGIAADYVQGAVRSELAAIAFPQTGETVSHYRILDGIGGGGMGLVYRAEDIQLRRQVALKFLPQESAKDAGALGRFEREARSASALEHPNICPIYEFGEHQGERFLAMQLLEGQTLRELIAIAAHKRPPLEVSRLLELAIQIVDGLHAAHRQLIIHRDIKPANIFVTVQGQAKILDFGLAKLVGGSNGAGADSEKDPGDADAETTPPDTEPLATSDPFLSRTGVAMGTAGYMSPEQARGEKLDARTDLFSFGLVLYEMATGKRAFKGDTGPALHDAILKHVATPARQLNPKLPAKFEQILNRALEKDRQARYQTAAEMRADLVALKQDLEQKPFSRRWRIATVAAVVGIIATAAFWFANHKPQSLGVVPDMKLRQLTFNSSENSVTGGAISPDGKYLAYSDAKGMQIKVIGTEETRPVPQPEALRNDNVTWDIVSNPWFPDDTRFIANAHPASENQSAWSSLTSSVWMVSALGGAPRKLRDNAIAYSVSSGGSWIGFGTNKGRLGDREIWLMGPSGDQARKIFDTDEESSLGGLSWSPDGKRVLYIRTDQSGDTLLSRDLKSGPPTPILGPSEMKQVKDFFWLADGRLLYSAAEPGSLVDIGSACNYWAMRLDARTGQPLEKPRRLTNWSGFCMDNTNITADCKRLTFKKWSLYSTTYIADLKPGGMGFLTTRHFTLSTSLDAPGYWTADSKALIVGSNRDGHWGIYKQAMNEDEPVPLVTGRDGLRNFLVSPDGNWILSVQEVRHGVALTWDPTSPIQVLRVPITGGTSQVVFTARPRGVINCARAPYKLCVISEPTEDLKQVVVTAFDPLEGRGAELARFDVGPKPDSTSLLWTGALSPDGTRIAVLPGRGGLITILSLRSHSTQLVKVNGWNNLQTLNWAADGRSLFVLNEVDKKLAILNIDLQGNAHLLRDNVWASDLPASPDGRHLAFMSQTVEGNMWMMENF